MKLVHPLFEIPIIFEENSINQVVIESPSTLSKIILELKDQINGNDGDFVLSSDKGEILAIKKTMEVYIDYFSFDFQNKKIISKLYNDLKEKAYNEDLYTKTIEIINLMQSYLGHLIDSIDCPLEILNEIDFNNFFKSAGLRINTDPDSNLERVIEYILIINEVLKVEVFILVNIKSYFDEKEVQDFYNAMCNRKINILLLENFESEVNYNEEKKYLIDKDLCHIY